MTDFDLSGRVAVVTGGSRGIGAAIVEQFARHGARVGFCHVGDHAAAEALVQRLTKGGADVAQCEADIADPAAVEALGAWAGDRFGPVDILVNGAGIGGDILFSDMTLADFDRMIGVHLRGTFLVTKQFYGPMAARGWGRVINISSQLAYKGAPGQSHYCAAKAGIVGFTRALAYEGALRGVTVNSIAPGPVDTQLLMSMSQEWRDMKMGQLPLGRFGRVEEIAPTALLLASEAGSFYIGQTLSPNGGDVLL
ncbi:SDR family NAD(P)-dependent oxidoreductase [Devosia naphthalenivorans]|uniref:SDR family NAD(P)-dependent oxidoreductase n=1 Tax=Devosia naphthalenivorans TaxID=2082392 RepID=UPI000D3CEB3A|nr:3-oxoacyl-ACP reductase family protein [Devosia naphthalenivorans]